MTKPALSAASDAVAVKNSNFLTRGPPPDHTDSGKLAEARMQTVAWMQ